MASGNRDFWQDRLSQDWSETGVGYRALGKQFNMWMYRLRREVFLREIRESPIDPASSRVFDIGSGTGFYVRLWKELGAAEITGSDITAAAVANLRERFPEHEFHEFDATDPQLPVPEGSFDVVNAMDILFHITDDAGHDQAIRNAWRLLRPGGWFVFSENFLHVPEQRGPRQANRSRHRIERSLLGAGFEVVRHAPMFVLMNAQVDSGWLRRRAWGAAMRAATSLPPLGWAAGAALYPLEKRLVRAMPEGPSTELMICRKPA